MTRKLHDGTANVASIVEEEDGKVECVDSETTGSRLFVVRGVVK